MASGARVRTIRSDWARSPIRKPTMQRFRRILVPTDFSECSKQVLPYVLDLVAENDQAEILLAHVVEPPIYPAMFEGATLVAPAFDPDMVDRVKSHLEEFARDNLADSKAGVRTFLRQGPPVHELVTLAKEEQADLIVIATHGHTGISHLLLGSTAEQIVRLAPCPVLTVRPPADGKD